MLIIVYCVAITLGLCLYWILHTEQARRFLIIHHNDCDHLHNRVPRDEAQAPLLNSPQSSPSNCASAANSPCSTQQGAVTREVVLSDSRLVGQITRHPSPPAVPSMRRLTIRTHPSATASGATTPTSSTTRYPGMGDQARGGSYRPARLFRSNSGTGGTLVTPNGVTVLQQVPTQNEYTWPTDDEDDDDEDQEEEDDEEEEAIDGEYGLTAEYVDEFHEGQAQNHLHNQHHRSSQRVQELQKAAQHLNRPRAIRPPPGRWSRKRPRTRETYVPLTSFSQRFSQDDETSTSGDATTTLAGAAATMIQIEAC